MSKLVCYNGDEAFVYVSFHPANRLHAYDIIEGMQMEGYRVRFESPADAAKADAALCLLSVPYYNDAVTRSELMDLIDGETPCLLLKLDDVSLPPSIDQYAIPCNTDRITLARALKESGFGADCFTEPSSDPYYISRYDLSDLYYTSSYASFDACIDVVEEPDWGDEEDTAFSGGRSDSMFGTPPSTTGFLTTASPCADFNTQLFGDDPVPCHEPKPVRPDQVQFSAVAPKILAKGHYTLIDLIMYEDAYRREVEKIISERDEPTQESRSGVLQVEDGTRVRVALSSPDIAIEDGTEEGVWVGRYLQFSFPVFLPEDYKKPQILLTATVYFNDLIATKLRMLIKCRSLFAQKIEVHRDDVLSAFISYAAVDRHRVAAMIQGMRKARPDMSIFFDVETLRSGDDWEQKLYSEIESRDVLFLCWSHHAAVSEWVDREWRYALRTKGLQGVEPLPLEPPQDCPPPKELAAKHFNDTLLFYTNI